MEIEWDEMAGLGFEGFNLSNRDQALFLIAERDLEAQLIAIKGALKRNSAAEAEATERIKGMAAQIKLLEPRDTRNADHLNDILTDMLHESVYHDAAHSMSAVGMLAPLVESLFVAIFAGLRDRAQADTNADPRSKATQDQFWNPQIVFSKDGPKDDIVRGITQLATSTGLQSFLPEGYQKSLSALFAYRNNMFHNGFEWPLETRHKFASRIKNDAWPVVWFSQATRGDDPWVFYMSDEFIAHCLQMIDQVLEGVGRYLAQNKDDVK
jgi:hypothetical protein